MTMNQETEKAIFSFIVDYELEDQLIADCKNIYIRDEVKKWLGVN